MFKVKGRVLVQFPLVQLAFALNPTELSYRFAPLPTKYLPNGVSEQYAINSSQRRLLQQITTPTETLFRMGTSEHAPFCIFYDADYRRRILAENQKLLEQFQWPVVVRK